MYVIKESGKINRKVLIVLIFVVTALGGSLFTARQLRRSFLMKYDLENGNKAFDQKDWKTACKHYQEYLGRKPDDMNVLRKYAMARMAVRPFDAANLNQAAAAYHTLFRLDPLDEEAYKQLTKIYTGTGNAQELAHISRTRLENVPGDIDASLWLAEALINLKEPDDANQLLSEQIDKLQKQPDKRSEYAHACVLMSKIVGESKTANASEEVRKLLSEAIAFAPESVEALAARAQFSRLTPDVNGLTAEARLSAARNDLEKADTIGTNNPQYLLFLAGEWIAHGQLDKAALDLQKADKLPPETIEEQYLDINNWKASKFLLDSELAFRTRNLNKYASLADGAAKDITGKGYRLLILPAAIRLYVAANKLTDANDCLSEYNDIVLSQQAQAQSRQDLAYLRALVASSQGKPYAVIDALPQSIMINASFPQMWGLLGEAYSQTGQGRRAVEALDRYVSLQRGNVWAVEQLAKEYVKLQDWDNVLIWAQEAKTLNPEKTEIKLSRIEASINSVVLHEQDKAARGKALADEAEELTQLRNELPRNTDVRILQAMIAFYLGDPNAAENELNFAAEQCDNPLKAQMQLSRLYSQTSQLPEAIRTCKSACKSHSETAESWLYLSRLYSMNQNYDKAIECLTEAQSKVTDEKDKRSISTNLAVLEAVHGDRASGIENLIRLADQDKYDISSRVLLLGIREVRENKTAKNPQELVDEIKVIEGESGLTWRINQSVVWLSSDEWRKRQQDIVTYLQYCIDSDPKWPAPALLMVNLYEKLQDSRKAEEVCRQAYVRNPSSVDITNKYVTILENQGRFEDAEKVLQQGEMNSQFAVLRKALLSAREGDFASAILEYGEAVRNDDKDVASRISLARLIYAQDKDADRALAYLKEAQDLAPDSTALITAKVAILKADGKTQEAEQILDDYVEDHNNFAAFWLRGEYYAEAGELERAEQNFRRLLTFTGQGTAGYEQLSGFYARYGNLDKATSTLEEGITLHPEDLKLKRQLMTTLLLRNRENDKQEAFGILAVLSDKLPRDTELLKLRALQLLASNTPDSKEQAIEKYKEVIALEPMAIDAHISLIRLALQNRSYQEARDYVTQALGSNPGNLPLTAERSKVELALGNIKTASELADTVLQKDPNNIVAGEVYIAAALISQDRDLLQRSRTLLEAAIARQPENESLLISWASVLVAMGQAPDGIARLEAYCQTEQGSRSVAALTTAADLYRTSGDMEKANQKIEQAENMEPDNQLVLDARLALAVTLYQTGNVEGSKQIYNELHEKYPRNAQVLNDLAWILQEHDHQYEQALELANEGLKYDPNDLHLLDTRGTILSKIDNQLPNAKADFEKCMELSPSDSKQKAQALLKLGRICIKLNESVEAKKYLENALEIDNKINVFTPNEKSEIEGIINGIFALN